MHRARLTRLQDAARTLTAMADTLATVEPTWPVLGSLGALCDQAEAVVAGFELWGVPLERRA